MPELLETLDSNDSLPRRGGGVNACLILTEASLNLWVSISCWSWKESKSNIHTWPEKRWPWCWLQACWCTLERTLWHVCVHWYPYSHLSWLTWLSWPSPHLSNTWKPWDKLESLKRLSFGRCWVIIADQEQQLERSLWAHLMDSDESPLSLVKWLLSLHECLESIDAWSQYALTFSRCLSRDAIVLPAEESVLIMILTYLERIADLNSWMKCLIASDSTVAWVIAYSSASADEWETEACVRLDDALLTEDNVISEPQAHLSQFLTSCPIWIWLVDNLNWNETLRIRGWNLEAPWWGWSL